MLKQKKNEKKSSIGSKSGEQFKCTPSRKKCYSQNIIFIKEAKKVIRGEKEPILYFQNVAQKIDLMKFDQRVDLSEDFCYKQVAEFIFSTENTDIISNGLIMLAKIMISPYTYEAEQLLTPEFLEHIFPVFSDNPGDLYSSLLCLIYGVLVNNVELLPEVSEVLFSKISLFPVTKHVILIADLYLKNDLSFLESAITLYTSGLECNDPEIIETTLISLRRVLKIEDCPEEAKALIFTAFTNNMERMIGLDCNKIELGSNEYNNRINQTIRNLWNQYFLFFKVLPEETEIPDSILTFAIEMIKSIDFSLSHAIYTCKDFVSAIAEFLFVFHDTFAGKCDQEIVEVMIMLINVGSYKSSASAFKCMLKYFNFDEWFNNEIGDMILSYAENAETAPIIFDFVAFNLQSHSDREDLLDLADKLVPIAEEFTESENQDLAEKSDLFVQAISEM